MQQLRGSTATVCTGGSWLPKLPKCVELDPHSRDEGAPPIRFELERGLHTVTPRGHLVVNISTTVRLQCLFPRNKGQPRWEVSSTYREYPQTWSRISYSSEHFDIDAYELTVSTARPEDGGFFHCVIPNGRRNTIKIIVKGDRR
ncbi:unnamed protein product [Gongylonema pulchrum]|uniref:Ig-like domain-containing protein n=1 Tax=Gongylonema pulchrum TaxID=637853 RepID=A0A183DAP4_9BILA|nr:unnamed protein product [Gongylonema pulchrum]